MTFTGYMTMFASTGVLAGTLITGSLDFSPPSIAAVPPVAQDLGPVQSGSLDKGFATIVKQVRPAIVNITASVSPSPQDGPLPGPFGFGPNGPYPRNPGWGEAPFDPGPVPPRAPRGMGVGSGVIVASDGFIVTNHHVIDGAGEVTVTLIDKREFAGRVIGSDPQTDLAVIKIKAHDLPFIPWGDSTQVEIGDYVLAIGNPFGLNSTVTQGIVSALGRGGMGITQYEDFIQTDAAINPGNSGGALVNTWGQLVGINTAILSRTGGNQGVGFAIPASMGKFVYDNLVKTGRVTRGYLGVGIQELTPDLATALHLSHSSGALVTTVKENTPADKAGLRQGDTIVRYQDLPISDPRSLQRAVSRTPAGDHARLTVMRDGAEIQLETTIESHPDAVQVAAKTPATEDSGLSGLRVTELTPQLASRLHLAGPVQGVVVEAVQPNSPPERAGLRPGDIISQVNRQPVRSLHEFQRAVSHLVHEQPALFLVNRQGMTVYLTVKV